MGQEAYRVPFSE